MGSVWEATQLAVQRPVALKILTLERGGTDSRRTRRFLREAAAGARVQHPGIVMVYGAGEDAGYHYIAQELVGNGRSLRHRLDGVQSTRALGGRYFLETAKIVRGVAEALAAAHNAGVVHRDIKPSNILLDAGERPKVADFGIAMLASSTTITCAGDRMGTPMFMSPEQLEGSPDIDPRTDVYSLGATLYEALTLCRPFGGGLLQIAHGLKCVDPLDPLRVRPEVPSELASICLQAMRGDPAERYPTMAAFAQALDGFLGGAAGSMPRPKEVPAPSAPVGRRRTLKLAVAAALLLAAGSRPRRARAGEPVQVPALTHLEAGARASDEVYVHVAYRGARLAPDRSVWVDAWLDGSSGMEPDHRERVGERTEDELWFVVRGRAGREVSVRLVVRDASGAAVSEGRIHRFVLS